MKNNEGYALPFVLVVMVIICLVGISILSSSLNNLQNQQASIERMQDQYAVAGEIEKVMAPVKFNKCVSVNTLGDLLVTDAEGKNEFVFTKGTEGKEDTLDFTLDTSRLASLTNESVQIKAKIRITGSITEELKELENGSEVTLYSFSDNFVITYLTYEITNVEEVGA